MWMELRCSGQDRIDCEEGGPMELTRIDAASVAATRRALVATARRKGWKSDGNGGLYCPACAKAH